MPRTPIVGTPEPDHSGFGTRQQMREEIVSLRDEVQRHDEQLDAVREALEWIEQKTTDPSIAFQARQTLSKLRFRRGYPCHLVADAHDWEPLR